MNFSKWLPLDPTVIEREVREDRGAYVLNQTDGTTDAETLPPEVHYVGRADTDLRDRLKKHAKEELYDLFRFAHVSTLKECFELECRLYHRFEPIDNEYHPHQPEGKNYLCPFTGCEYATRQTSPSRSEA